MTLVLWLGACAHRPSPAPVVHDPGPVPELAFEWYAHAAFAAERGDHEEAGRAAGWLVRVDGGRSWTWLAVARVWAQLGDEAAAMDAAQRACTLDPGLDSEVRAAGWGGCAPPDAPVVR